MQIGFKFEQNKLPGIITKLQHGRGMGGVHGGGTCIGFIGLKSATGQLLIPTAFKTSSWPMLLKQVVANAFNTSGGQCF